MVLLLLVSCTQTQSIPSGTVDELPTFSHIELTIADEIVGIEGPDARFVNVEEGTGMVVGALGGAAVGSAVCASTIWFGPGLCILGMFTAGAAGGVLFDWANAPRMSYDDSLYVAAALNRASDNKDFQSALIDDFHSRLPSHIFAESEEPRIKVTPHMANIGLVRPRKEILQIDIGGWLIFSWLSEDGSDARYTVEFRSRSEEADIDAWLSGGGVMFDDAISRGVQRIAGEMAAFIDQQRLSQDQGATP
ncbi:MAG: hypothetical protein KJN90_09160 [Gammaproteobacteria bacterium]|nr:hypothetical protein [Gammaproteobacteria bacterium]